MITWTYQYKMIFILGFIQVTTYNMYRHSPLRIPIPHFGRVKPRRFISCALRNSRQASVGFEPRTSRSAGERATNVPTRPENQLS